MILKISAENLRKSSIGKLKKKKKSLMQNKSSVRDITLPILPITLPVQSFCLSG